MLAGFATTASSHRITPATSRSGCALDGHCRAAPSTCITKTGHTRDTGRKTTGTRRGSDYTFSVILYNGDRNHATRQFSTRASTISQTVGKHSPTAEAYRKPPLTMRAMMRTEVLTLLGALVLSAAAMPANASLTIGKLGAPKLSDVTEASGGCGRQYYRASTSIAGRITTAMPNGTDTRTRMGIQTKNGILGSTSTAIVKRRRPVDGSIIRRSKCDRDLA
jgi:hypothetical protein